ncbi:uncharacterized protein LOC133155543 [Syngnathus typhle]|uniref:uncharacterized protein LOC133155543 n=1 Tax=Syngnathus typhle TaxID=161592 RepID=UPI002A6B86B1|nr:uncharacterized protein LOC133155543 [Syngnathus typhle]
MINKPVDKKEVRKARKSKSRILTKGGAITTALRRNILQLARGRRMNGKEGSARTMSCASHASVRSKASSTEAAGTKARAKAEAAKARLSYARKEMSLKVEKAQLEAKMDMLSLQQEAAAALAEADVLEAAVEGSLRSSTNLNLERLFEAPVDTLERTKEYVAKQVETPLRQTTIWNETQRYESPDVYSGQHSHHQNGSKTPSRSRDTPATRPYSNNMQDSREAYRSSSSSYHLPSSQTSHRSLCDQTKMADFARYLARRELVSTSLIKFDDQPCSYRAWKQSFLNAIKDLNLTPSEQMDLLVAWLGEESAEHAKRIRAVHVNSADRGLRRIWERLETCYGAPEMVEDSLFERIASFPKINRDYLKLHELSDFLIELKAAKADGDLPGLTYLDTARGLHLLVRKLPFNLQEKWLTVGTNYKLQHRVSFPPFDVFVDFVEKQARIRNDPGFKFTAHLDTSKAGETQRKPIFYDAVSVHKTDVLSSPTPAKPRFEIDDPETQCPIQKKPHPLKKCRSFRKKPLEQRKTLLKDNAVCLKCTSTQHNAKNCQFIAKCETDKHISAIPPEPAPGIQEPSAPTQDDGEKIPEPCEEVSTRCTEVSGDHQNSRSCSKICLVKVYPSGRPDRALKMYAIIDEQSNVPCLLTIF